MAITSTGSPSLPGASGACTGLIAPTPSAELPPGDVRLACPGRASRLSRRGNSGVPEGQLGTRGRSWGASVLRYGLAGGRAQGGLEPGGVAGLPRPVGAHPLQHTVDEPHQIDLVERYTDA